MTLLKMLLVDLSLLALLALGWLLIDACRGFVPSLFFGLCLFANLLTSATRLCPCLYAVSEDLEGGTGLCSEVGQPPGRRGRDGNGCQ